MKDPTVDLMLQDEMELLAVPLQPSEKVIARIWKILTAWAEGVLGEKKQVLDTSSFILCSFHWVQAKPQDFLICSDL